MTTRKELTEAIGTRYRAGSRSEKQKILDEFVALTGCHRKHAIRALNGERATDVEKKGRSRIYDEAARQALILLWEAADRVCGKRLKALIPMLIDAISGFVTRGRGDAVHRSNCSNCSNLCHMAQVSPGRVIDVAWGHGHAVRASVYPLNVVFEAADRQGLLRDIGEVFAERNRCAHAARLGPQPSLDDLHGGSD